MYRVDAATGRQEPWKTIAPADPAGLASLYALQIADDGAWYYYTDMRELSDLYLVRGLR